jgi:ADP-ribose pyrophosphatase YjhB (NUDIX family)
MFNVRVYGICIQEGNLLVADERIKGMEITKLPGGGLEFGEGTRDCLAREFMEETGQKVEVLNHFFTTDFFVPSAFDKKSQVISIYYLVKFNSAIEFKTSKQKMQFETTNGDVFSFRWVTLEELCADIFTFPIDKKVAEMIVADYK